MVHNCGQIMATLYGDDQSLPQAYMYIFTEYMYMLIKVCVCRV